MLHAQRLRRGRAMIKSVVKTSVGLAAPRVPQLRAELERSLSVFLYHDVSDAPAPFSLDCHLAVSVRQFERQLAFIAETFNVISIDELLTGRVPQRAALITFDDGVAGIFQHALPALRRVGLPSIIFLNMAPVLGEPFWAARAVYLCRHTEGFLPWLTERVGRRALDSPHLACTPALVEEWERAHGDHDLKALPRYLGKFATPDDLEEADRDPLVTFGNHLYRHYNILNLSDAELEAEFRSDAEALSSYRGSRPVLAFPFGHGVSDRHVSLLLGWGLKRLFTGISSLNRDPAAPILHRVSLTSWHDRPSRMWFQIARAAIESGAMRAR